MATHTDNVLSLYAGGGGLDIGFKMAVPTARTICYVERDIASVSVLVEAIEKGRLDDAPIWSDSSTFDGRPWRKKVDWIIGGFPCQPWSVAGNRAGEEDERWLWDDISCIIRSIQPWGLFLENVSGLITGHGLDHILGDLSEMGYDAEWGSVKAADVGANHRRERVFILAYGRGFGWRRWGEENDRRFEQQVQAARSLSRDDASGDDTEYPGRNTSSAPSSNKKTISNNSQGKKRARKSARAGATANAPKRVGKGKHGKKSSGRRCQAAEAAQFPVFPPGPGSSAWKQILRAYPDYAPAVEKTAPKPNVRGMANGVARGLHRVDRLRILGNGVVPVQASYAFKLLVEQAKKKDAR